MKWKTWIGAGLIIFSIAGMILWERFGRGARLESRIAELESQIVMMEEKSNPANFKGSFFPIPDEWIYASLPDIPAGGYVDIYALPSKKMLGRYLVSGVYAEAGSSFGLSCTASEFFKLYDAANLSEDSSLLIVTVTGD